VRLIRKPLISNGFLYPPPRLVYGSPSIVGSGLRGAGLRKESVLRLCGIRL